MQPTMGGRVLPWQLKSVMRIRQDIKTWKAAYEMAMQAEYPTNAALQELYQDCMLDALLTSQIENRKRQLLGSQWNLTGANGEPNEESTNTARNMPAFGQLMHAVLDSHYYGYSLIELSVGVPNNELSVGVHTNRTQDLVGGSTNRNNRPLITITIPRTNVVPKLGRFLPDAADPGRYTQYRELREYGTWILEIDTGEPGILNKAVPHVLFKRFAQSCWSELCEIYGIPPRVMKTNVQDPNMLNRAESMMRDMGAAAWFIIDETENFEWAETQDTNGDVYNNLIRRCSEEISLLISGAVIGQDTANGNRSKETASQDMLWNLILADMEMVQTHFNHTILPALARIGILPAGLMIKFEPEADLEALFKYTTGFLQHYTVPPDWILETFGVPVEPKQLAAPPSGGGGGNDNQLSLAPFFD
jgi:hypothetical protein